MLTNCPECGHLFLIHKIVLSDVIFCPHCEARLRILGKNPIILHYEEDTSKFALDTSINHVCIIDTTLREGEQFANAFFSTRNRLRIVELLEEFGVEAIEITTPISSKKNFDDAKAICSLGTKAKIFAHVRCAQEDIERAAESGVQGVNILFGTSKLLRRYSHGKSLEQVKDIAISVIDWTRKTFPHLEVRFSAEDAFRSDINELLYLYRHLKNFVDRFGLPDTTGIATPVQVYRLTKFLHNKFHIPLEFHGHNDTCCAVANASSFLEAGGTYVNTTVIGIGERNGICPLSGLVSRVITLFPEIQRQYNLSKLVELDRYVADVVGVDIPFTQPLTSKTAFTHKAGIHTKAVLQNPQSYEIIDPAIFGIERTIHYASSVTGKHAIKQRLFELGYTGLHEDVIIEITSVMKNLSAERKLTSEEFDRELEILVAQKVNTSNMN